MNDLKFDSMVYTYYHKFAFMFQLAAGCLWHSLNVTVLYRLILIILSLGFNWRPVRNEINSIRQYMVSTYPHKFTVMFQMAAD